ncbi:MAG: glycosyltransferase family 2 protein, partial [Chloroflexota bacterium]
RKHGGVIWLDPNIRATYYARATLAALAQQYWRYGYWKVRMLLSYQDTIRWRQIIPPVFVVSIILFLGLSAFSPFFALLLTLEVVLYAVLLASAGIQIFVTKKKFFYLIGVPLAIATMHVFWGGAFLWSSLSSFFKKKNGNEI